MRKVSDSFLFVLGLVLLALGVPGVLDVVILVLSLPLVRPTSLDSSAFLKILRIYVVILVLLPPNCLYYNLNQQV
jgi:hypothetical protein